MQKASAACTNYYTRQNPRVKSSIIIILAAIALLLVLAQAVQCRPFRKDGQGIG
jgi:hypothetical protein